MRVLFLAALGLAGFAAAPPPGFQALQASVHQRVPYAYQRGWHLTYVPVGLVQAGNCVAFAYTAYTDLQRRHLPAHLYACTLTSGVPHAFTVAEGFLFDVRQAAVIPYSPQAVGCANAPQIALQ